MCYTVYVVSAEEVSVMDKYCAKPQGNYVVLVILWLLAGGAVAIVVTMLRKYDTSALNTVIFTVIPAFFFIPAIAATFATMASSLSVEEGTVRCVMASGFRRHTVEFALSDVRAVWPYRRTVSMGRHMQVVSGCAFKRADGAILHLDLTLYTDIQRSDFLAAVCAAGKDIETLPFVPDKGKVYASTMPPQWEAPLGGSDTEVVSVREKDEQAVDQAQEALDQAKEVPQEEQDRSQPVDEGAPSLQVDAAESAHDAQPKDVYHYTVYEGEGSVRCGLCGARIASAVTPGDHQTGGYLAASGKKWVCKGCWARFAKDYRWVSDD